MDTNTVTLPLAPRNASPVPHLTSIHSSPFRGPYGHAKYPGNCGGYLIRDLLSYFKPKRVFDPMSGSGTARDVCRELGVECYSADLRSGFDCQNPDHTQQAGTFDFVWIHPPYFRQKVYSKDPRDLSTAPTLEVFLTGLWQVVVNCRKVLSPGGRMAVLMGDYSDREFGFLPLTYYTKRLCFDAGLVQRHTDIVRFQHNNSSSKKTYSSSFIPGIHDTCLVVQKPLASPSPSPMFDLIDEDVFCDIVSRNFGFLEEKYAKAMATEILDELREMFSDVYSSRFLIVDKETEVLPYRFLFKNRGQAEAALDRHKHKDALETALVLLG